MSFVKWTGDQAEITIRGVAFAKGARVEVADDLAAKVLSIPGFVEAKKPATKRPANAKNKD